MSFNPGIFRGDDLAAWVAHFKFNDKLLEYLTEELGVNTVNDLGIIYEDEELIKEVEGKLSRVDFRKFVKSREWTNVDVAPPTTIIATTVTSTRSAVAGMGMAAPLPVVGGMGIPAPPMPPVDSGTVRRETVTKTSSKAAATTATAVKPVAAPPGPDTRVEMARKMFAAKVEEKTAADEADRLVKEMTERAHTIDKRKIKLRVLDKKIAESASVDLAFVLDCTGSMGPYLDSAKNEITNFARNIKSLHPNVSLRLAFVGYRDHCDGDTRLVVMRFASNNVDEFTRIVAAQDATGGGDGPEDVLGGLNVVKSFEWQSATRIVYLIADAPAHGTDFHEWGAGADSYPDGDPHGLQPTPILKELRDEKKVEFYFGKINSHTDKMIRRFNELLGPSPNPDEDGAYYIKETPMDPGTMMAAITSSVSRSMADSISSSSRTESKRHEKKAVTLHKVEPSWAVLPEEESMRFPMTMPDSIESMIEVMDLSLDKCISDFPDSLNCRLKVAPFPFATGAMRAAYYAMLSDGRPMIVKESLYASKSQLTKPKYEATLQCHRAAKFLSSEFNTRKPSTCPKVDFCDGCILQFMARRDQPFMVMESRIPGVFEKYNSNSGYCAPSPTVDIGTAHEAVQAFSHWTHHVTRGHILVVDCQGGFDVRQGFMLTDPAVHCKDLSRFGDTNLGSNGIRRFFDTHKCNDVCRALGLPVVAAASIA